ncbi:MAG TPA: hypothetical protein VG992_00400 [Candidatus Saccharimonadales bacterium]|nr:hypothetical protein [Candidatus Saccharimonadales bacterium]
MYSGSTVTNFSGRLLGAHQKIDRMARRHLEHLAPSSGFPGVRSILRFEGSKGPDAIKRKSPAKDEPWHFLQPFDTSDTQLLTLIEAHYRRLVEALQIEDHVRASFEAAWLAHAVVDGLTPAHHYPYEEKVSELRGGQGMEYRTSVKEKTVFPGETLRHQAKNNWRFWGPKGLFTTHFTFEWGVAMLLAPMKIRRLKSRMTGVTALTDQPVAEWFRGLAQDVAQLELYDAFYESGWTINLARRVRRQLAPVLVQAVAAIWYAAAEEAGLASRQTS